MFTDDRRDDDRESGRPTFYLVAAFSPFVPALQFAIYDYRHLRAIICVDENTVAVEKCP